MKKLKRLLALAGLVCSFAAPAFAQGLSPNFPVYTNDPFTCNSLVPGAGYYWSSAQGALRVCNGSAWSNVLTTVTPTSTAPGSTTFSGVNVTAGSSNTAGGALNLAGGIGTGTGAPGSLVFQIAPASTTGTTANTLQTAGQFTGTNFSIGGVNEISGGAAATLSTIAGYNGVGTNQAAGGLTVSPGVGTGTGTGYALSLLRPIVAGSGTSVEITAPAIVICPSKIMNNTSATLTTMIQIGLPTTLTAVSGTMFYGTTATSATAVDADAASMNFAAVSLSGTVTAAVGTLSSIAQQGTSGTVASTATAPVVGTNVNLSLSPTYGTIVPTAVTSFMRLELFSGTNVTVTCQ